jgi:hypothetical protein
VTRIAPGVVSLVNELRGHERQAAEELGQWKTGVEEPKVIDASRTAIALAMILTTAKLEEEGRWNWRRRRAIPRLIDSQAPVPATGQAAAVPTLHEAVFLGKKRDAENSLRRLQVWSRIRAVAKECDARPISSRCRWFRVGPGISIQNPLLRGENQRWSCTHRASIDSHPAPFSREDVKRIPKQVVRALPRQQHRDQPRCPFLGADAVHLIEDVDRPVALPRELDSHRLTLLRDPDSVDAPEGAHVALACHGNSERFLLVRQHNRFQDRSV